MLFYVHRDRTNYYGRGAQDVHHFLRTAPEFWSSRRTDKAGPLSTPRVTPRPSGRGQIPGLSSLVGSSMTGKHVTLTDTGEAAGDNTQSSTSQPSCVTLTLRTVPLRVLGLSLLSTDLSNGWRFYASTVFR